MVISLGGAFLRIWRPRQGLAAEIPTCAVVSQLGEVVAVGEEAASMEGKLVPGLQFFRPFFSDRIVHRSLLRELLVKGFEQAQEQSGIPWERFRVTLLLPSTVSSLHADWLTKTIREAGAGFVQVRDPLAGLIRQRGRPAEVTVAGVVDWGFSQVRVVLYSGREVLAASAFPYWSVSELCRSIVARERTHTGRIFPVSSLYGQQWSAVRTAFDEGAGQPVQATLKSELVVQSKRQFREGVWQSMKTLSQSLQPEQAAFFRQHGWLIVGGGASLMEDVEGAAHFLGVPIQVAGNATYASLQGAGA